MDIVVDGVIFELNPVGGVARIFREIIPRMCLLDESLQVTLLVNRQVTEEPFHSKQIHLDCLFPPFDRILRPRKLLWPIIPLTASRVKQRHTHSLVDAIWHSTYHTSPRRWRGPIITSVQDLIHERFPDLQTGGMNTLIRRQKQQSVQEATIVLCSSQSTANDVKEVYGISEEKLRVVHLAYSPVFRPLPPDDNKVVNPFILYVGARNTYKNFTLLLQAYAVWKGRSDFRLTVVGPQWSAQELKLIHKLGLENNVQLVGRVDDKILCRLYNQAALFVYPSRYEGFGIPLLEAAACGCPVVSSRIPTSVEIAGDFPVYFQPDDTESLNNALDMAVQEGRPSARTARGLAHVQTYSWDRTALETLALYRSVSG